MAVKIRLKRMGAKKSPFYRIVAADSRSPRDGRFIEEIGTSHIQTLIMDLSGVAIMDVEVINHLIRVINGISMMGCKTVITGLRPEIVKMMINMDIKFDSLIELKGTLQFALTDYLGFK